jgi:predicted RNA-binding Zn ribbon-like protein
MDANHHSHVADLETALDFVNTVQLAHGEQVDHFGTTTDAVGWLHEHGLAHDQALDGSDDEALLGRVRRARAALRELAEATYEGRPPAEAAIDEINRLLGFCQVLHLVPTADGLRLGHRDVGDPIDGALARLVEPIVREIATGRPERLRACADEACRWVFYDDSRTGRRRWCDMAVCGNRAKAARHRARAKGTDVAPPH